MLNLSSSESERVLRRRSVQLSMLVGFWTLVALIYITLGTAIHLTVETEVPAGASGRPFELSRALWTLVAWYTWIPSTLVVIWLVRHFPLERQRIFPNVLVHVLAAPAVSLFASLLFTGARSIPRLLGDEPVGAWFTETVIGTFARSVRLDSFIYLTILAGVHAFVYYRKYRERELSSSRLQNELAEAQLHALKMQLHPHFLFNTFHTIAMLVRDKQDEAATDMIAGLSSLFRYVLDHAGRQEVPLARELDFLEQYLAIEKIRFKDGLEVSMQVDGDVLQAYVPTLLLQPIVENSIRHGIDTEEQPGRVEVTARREGERVRLRVRDNGKGLPDGWHLEDTRGIGLNNTRARLRRLYGDDHHFDLSPASPAGGLMVTMVLPYHTDALPTDVPVFEAA